MARVLLYYAHPGHRHSHVNRAMYDAAAAVEGITQIDLYAAYPRQNIDIDREQALLLDHDVILFQHPLFWYSTPSLIKEWVDLVLEHGFAYGADGDKLMGKTLMQAISAAGSSEAYTPEGYQHFPLRTFLTPMEQTARLCKMRYGAPYVLHSALQAPAASAVAPHVAGFVRLLQALRDDAYDFDTADKMGQVDAGTLPIKTEA